MENAAQNFLLSNKVVNYLTGEDGSGYFKFTNMLTF